MTNDLAGATVLVTGGCGFIGSNCAHRFWAEGAHVRVLDSFLPGSGANPSNLDDIHGRIEFLEGDVRDRGIVSEAVKDADLIVHCAALTSHTRSMADVVETLDVNCRGTLQLLETVRNSDADPKLVHVGTTTQLGPMIQEPANELHPEFPRDMYSATMVSSEKFVLMYANVYGLRATVVRLCNTYGPRAAIHSMDLGFVNYFIGLGLQKRTLTVYGDGKQRRSLLYVDDAVEALRLAALGDATDGEVFFAGSDGTYTVGEIAEAIASHIGGEASYVPWPEGRKAIDVGDAVIDNSKIHGSLGWTPKVDLETGLARTRDYYATNLATYLEKEA